MSNDMSNLNMEREKLEIIKWVTSLKDDTAIERLRMLRAKPRKLDWWNEITDEENRQLTKGWQTSKLDE